MKSKLALVVTVVAIAIVVILLLCAVYDCWNGPEGPVEWSPAKLEIDVVRGTSQVVMLTAEANKNTPNIQILVVPALEPFLTVYDGGIDTLPENKPVSFAATVQVPADTPLGKKYDGTVQIRQGSNGEGRDLASPLPVILRVVEASADVIPDEPAHSTPDRITQNEIGQKWVKDEVIALLNLDTVDPEKTIKEIAATTGGVILGSIAKTFTYQIQYETADDKEPQAKSDAMASLPQVTPAMHKAADDRELQARTDTVHEAGEYGVLQAKINAVARFPQVRAAVRNWIADDPAATTPNDPEYDAWDETTPAGNNYHFEMVRAPTAWDTTTGSTDVKVGVIDMDIRTDHEDLTGNVHGQGGPHLVCGANKPGHGTHVSGIIGAKGNNALGVAGMSWDLDLRGYDFTLSNCSILDVYDKMVAAVEDDVDIINMSIQMVPVLKTDPACGPPNSQNEETIADMVEHVNDLFGQAILFAQGEGKDVLWVFGAGNDCRDTKYASPASLVARYPENTMAVAAVGQDGSLWREPDKGSNDGSLVTVAAPGEDIQTIHGTHGNCRPGQKTEECPEAPVIDAYKLTSGTSTATAMVTGLAALLKAAYDKTAAEIRTCIVDSADSSGEPIDGVEFSVINAQAALAACAPEPE